MRPIRQGQNPHDMSCDVDVAKEPADSPDLISAGHDETDLRKGGGVSGGEKICVKIKKAAIKRKCLTKKRTPIRMGVTRYSTPERDPEQ